MSKTNSSGNINLLEEKFNLLNCPNCNGDNLHQKSVGVFFRDFENSITGTHIQVSEEKAYFDNKMTENPSGRRDGLFIEFYCEGCEDLNGFILEIIQHKGVTFISWNKPVQKGDK